MNRSLLYLLIALAVPSAALAPAASPKDTNRDNLITVETRSLEVLTKASIYYFQVAKKTEFNTFDRELEFITDDRLKAFEAFEKGLKHSDAVRSTCEPVKQLLEILETTQQELLTNEDKSKQVVVKLSFKKPSDSVLLKFEFYKILNEETKTVESVGLRISIFGFKEAASDTLINFLKACALHNTAWQDIKPFAIGDIISASVVTLVLGARRVYANQQAMTLVEPVLKGLGEEVATQLDRYHQYHPTSLVRHTHPKYSTGLLSTPTRVAPWHEYNQPTLHEGIWQRFGLTFAAGSPSESAHKKSASVVVTAWLPGSFSAFCQTAAWEEPKDADQERIIIVPYSVFKADVANYQNQQLTWVATEAQLTETNKKAVERIVKAFGENDLEKLQQMNLQATAHKEQLARAKQSILMTENLNVGGWSVVVINDGSTKLDVITDSPENAFLNDLSSYVVVTTANLVDAATTKISASCVISETDFTVTAEKTTATVQETLAQLVVDALLSSIAKEEVTYEESSATPSAQLKSVKVLKTDAATLPSRRVEKSPTDITLCSDVRLPMHVEFTYLLDRSAEKTEQLAGLRIFSASTNEFTPELTHFLTLSSAIAGKQAPRLVIVPSPCIELCSDKKFIAALNTAQATVVVLNMGTRDDYKKTETFTAGALALTTSADKNFVTYAQKLLATAERAIIVPADITQFTWKGGTQRDFKESTPDYYPHLKTKDSLRMIYAV